MKYPILSAYNTFNTAPIALWSFDAAGNLASDRPDLPPALLIDSVCRAVEPSQNGPEESLLLTGGYVTFPVTPLLDVGTEDFSVCAWIRTEDYGIVKIIDKRIENSGPLQGWTLCIYQGKFNLQLADGRTWLGCYFDRLYRNDEEKKMPYLPVISDNQWHHVAVTVDRDREDGGRWYVDGRETGVWFKPISLDGSLSNNIPLTVGRRSDNFGGIYRGNIGDMRLYKQAISAAEVESIYRSIQSPISHKIVVSAPALKNYVQSSKTTPQKILLSDSANSSLERYSQTIEYYKQMKYPILSVYNSLNTPIALWSFDAAGNLASDRPDLPPALLIDSVCRAVEPSQNGPEESLLLTGGYVTFPVTPLLDVGTEDFSVCAWIRTEDYGIVKIIDKRIENSGPLQGWGLFIYQGKFNLQMADGKSWLNCAIDHYEKIAHFPVVSDKQWHHVAVTVDRDRMNGGCWYVDGKEVGWRFRPIHQQGFLSNNIPLTVGRRSDNFGGIYRGNIGDMRLYKQALSAAGILSIYRSIQSPINQKFFVNLLKRPEIARPEQDSFSDSNNSTLERYSQAIAYYQESLNIQRNNGNGYGEANSLNNLGNIYSARGEYSQALDCHQQALNIQRDIGNRSGEAESLNALGSIYDALGEYLQAIDCHQQSLNIRREIGNRHGEIISWRDLGSAYHSLGEYLQAIECQKQALDRAQKINSKFRELNSLNALGRTYVSLGENQLAIEYCENSLNLARKIDSRFGEANSLVILGNAYSNLGHYLRAIAHYKQSLDIQQEIGDRSGEATCCRNLGNAYRCLGQYQRAIEYSRKSLEIARAIGEKASEAATLNNLGLALFDFGKFAEAETVLGEAIQIWESLRGKLSDRDNFKVSIFETQAATYRHLEKTLIVQKKTKQALEIAERGRARAFVELLGARLSANSDAIPDIEPPNIARIQEIANSQNATFVEYSISFLEELFIWVIQPTGEIAFRQVDLNYEHTSLKELVADSREAIGIRNRDFNPTLKIYPGDLVKLHDDAPNWEPWQVISVDETHNILSLCQSSWPPGLTIPRPAIDVAAKVESSLTNHPRLQKLHQLLIEPIADLLPTYPAAKIIFIPQGELFLVPFPALQDAAGKYLIEKHTILTAPAIQILELTSQKRQDISNLGGDILVVGNPTMPEVALVPGKPPQQLSALPHSETEAKAIAKLFKTQALTGNSATKAAVLQRLSDARIVHFATHGLLDRTRGLGSAIAFAPDATDSGLLTAEEILHLHLQADLVVLSACNTGMGRITGDGVIGLSRALISAGTSSVIVSLWAVPDAPTADLMVKFYQNLDRTGNKAQALRSAMLETMQQHPNPRDWAAFTLIGEA